MTVTPQMESTRVRTVHPLAQQHAESVAHDTDFTTAVAEMVADHAPRLFAVVLEYGEQTDARIAAWGMTLDDGAYMTTADGKNQYVLAEPENALRYVRRHTNITPHLVWVVPPALEEPQCAGKARSVAGASARRPGCPE